MGYIFRWQLDNYQINIPSFVTLFQTSGAVSPFPSVWLELHEGAVITAPCSKIGGWFVGNVLYKLTDGFA